MDDQSGTGGWQEQLDELVHQEKAGEASDINNAGVDAQVKFLLEAAVRNTPEFDPAHVRRVIAELREEFKEAPPVLEALDRLEPSPTGMEEG
jgi:hypothetical protein